VLAAARPLSMAVIWRLVMPPTQERSTSFCRSAIESFSAALALTAVFLQLLLAPAQFLGLADPIADWLLAAMC